MYLMTNSTNGTIQIPPSGLGLTFNGINKWCAVDGSNYPLKWDHRLIISAVEDRYAEIMSNAVEALIILMRDKNITYLHKIDEKAREYGRSKIEPLFR